MTEASLQKNDMAGCFVAIRKC